SAFSIQHSAFRDRYQDVALLGFALLALDPFVAGLSGLLHVDGLLMTFSLLSLLALARALRTPRGNFVCTAVSGSAAALALLSKSPGLLLIPLALAGIRLWRSTNPRNPILQSLTWLASFAIVTVGVLPALMVAPQQVWQVISSESGRQIENALRPTFFMGQAAFDHGLLFYPMALLLRLGPIVLVGLLLLLWKLFRNAEERQDFMRSLPSPNLILLLWAMGFVAAISLAAKKFDRYMLPAIPALALLAAWGWARTQKSRWLLPGLTAVQLAYFLAFVPYPLAAFNPLAGGPWLARHVITVGWGEAIGAAGRWLAALPDTAEATAVADIPPSLAPFFPGHTLPDTPENRAQANYLIVTLNGRQLAGDDWQLPVPGAELLHTIRYGGLEQAWVYRNPAPQPPPGLPQTWLQPQTFGGQVQLWGLATAVTDKTLTVYAQWGLAAPTSAHYNIKFTLRDAAGQIWSGLETALLNDVYFYPEHWTPGTQPVVRYDVSLPLALPPDNYTIELSVFDEAGAQLAVQDGDGLFRGVTVSTEPTSVPPRPQIPALAALDIPVSTDFSWLDGALWLHGRSHLPDSVLTGGKLGLDLYWQGERPLPAHLPITLSLGGRALAQQPLSRYDTALWRAGELVQEKITLTVPPDLPGGPATLTLHVGNGMAVTLGDVDVIETDRLFVLPEDIPLPLAYDFGGVLALRGMSEVTGRVGETAVLTLYWQMEAQPTNLYTVFVHLLNADGSIITQSDQWPGGLPTDSYVNDEVVIDEVRLDIPPDLPPGAYALRVGVYTAADGTRLPVNGTDFVILPRQLMVNP
ncbi:MAG: glycosyltransferase family 39 protein, partial [Anaerolineales bacterium]|nr:glycosyltransferase family 39 protein [Anaerolineales bacterium]